MNTVIHKALALMLPVGVAVLLTGFIPPQQSLLDPRLQLQRLKVANVDQLEAAFRRLDYTWPPQDTVPPVEVSTLPADLAKVRDVKKKKSLFFRALLPIVLAELERVAQLRQQLVQSLDKGAGQWDEGERKWLRAIARQYQVKGPLEDAAVQQQLLRRVDAIPPALVLAQAANESAWGTSRFARLGNNLFGQWTYRESEGIVPLKRPQGERYAVRSFQTIDASVRAYLRNLNTHPAYQGLRQMRQQMRQAGQPLDARRLATGLEAYSARGEAYIDELQRMMRGNRLHTVLEGVSLDRSGASFSQSPPAESTAG